MHMEEKITKEAKKQLKNEKQILKINNYACANKAPIMLFNIKQCWKACEKIINEFLNNYSIFITTELAKLDHIYLQ